MGALMRLRFIIPALLVFMVVCRGETTTDRLRVSVDTVGLAGSISKGIEPKLVIQKDWNSDSPITIVEVLGDLSLTVYDSNESIVRNPTIVVFQAQSLVSLIGDDGLVAVNLKQSHRVITPLFPDRTERFSRIPVWMPEYSWRLDISTVISFNGKRYTAGEFAQMYARIESGAETAQQESGSDAEGPRRSD